MKTHSCIMRTKRVEGSAKHLIPLMVNQICSKIKLPLKMQHKVSILYMHLPLREKIHNKDPY